MARLAAERAVEPLMQVAEPQAEYETPPAEESERGR